MVTRPTPVQEKAFRLLNVSPVACTQQSTRSRAHNREESKRYARRAYVLNNPGQRGVVLNGLWLGNRDGYGHNIVASRSEFCL